MCYEKKVRPLEGVVRKEEAGGGKKREKMAGKEGAGRRIYE